MEDLHNQIYLDTGVEVALQIWTIKTGFTMQEPQPQLRVGAIHVDIDNSLPFDQGQQLFQTYSPLASHFPSGIQMQLIPETPCMNIPEPAHK